LILDDSIAPYVRKNCCTLGKSVKKPVTQI
jgi:hypothetical protein